MDAIRSLGFLTLLSKFLQGGDSFYNAPHIPKECLEGWSQYGDHCYKVSHTLFNWSKARDNCLESRADLASISSADENNFIKGLTATVQIWIGLNSRDSGFDFKWSDGASFALSFWASGEPNFESEKCVVLRIGTGKWNNVYCGQNQFYVCKMEGIVPCDKTAIGMENGVIGNVLITSSSHINGYEPFNARLNHQSSWCKNLSESSDSYLQVNTNATHLICAIGIQGRNESTFPSFVKEFELEFSFDGVNWDFYRSSAGALHFQGNNDTEKVQKHVLFQTVYAQYVRIWPTDWFGNACMRIELYGRTLFSVDSEKTPPLVPSIAVYSIGIHSFSIFWEKPALYLLPVDVIGFKIIYHPVADLNQTNVTIKVDKNITSYKISGLVKNQTYCVWVLAYNGNGDGEISSCSEATTVEACLQGWIQFNSDCYLLVNDPTKNWTEAEIDCLDRNSELVYILSSEEDQFIHSEIINKSTVYEAFIGLQENGALVNRFPFWSNGDNVGFTNWRENSTGAVSGGTACVVKKASGSGKWGAVNCALLKPYICKRRGFSSNSSLCGEDAIGIETEFIPDMNFTASSYHPQRPPWAARLGAYDGWRPSVIKNSFLQIDLGVAYYVCAVATQGNPVIHGRLQNVIRYTLQLSMNGIEWKDYEKKFSGNVLPYRVTKNDLNSGVVAQFVRFLPDEWHDYPVLRVEVYGTHASPFPAPTMGPTILLAHATSSSAIQFQLSPPRLYYALHNVIMYIVHYQKVEESIQGILDLRDTGYMTNVTFGPGNATAILTRLEAYTKYCLSAQLISTFGAGPFGISTTVMTLEDVPDRPPAEITAQASSSTSVTIRWNPVPRGYENGVVTGFRVLYFDAANTQPKLNVTVGANISSVELKDLLVYTNYCIEALAFTSQGDGIKSDCVTTVTGEDVPRSPPANLTVQTAGNTSLSVSWKPVPPGHENGVIIGYKVFYVDISQSKTNRSVNVSSSVLSVNLTNLLVYTNYCVQVVAFTREGEGVLSECVMASTDEGVPSAAPTSPSAAIDLDNVLLSWGPVSPDSRNGKLTKYAVQVQESDIFLFVGPSYLSLNLKRANFSVDSCFKIAAVTKAGLGKLTDCVEVSVVFDITSLTAVTASKETSLSSVKVTWEHPTKGILGTHLRGYCIKYQVFRQGGELITESEAKLAKTIVVGANSSEVILKSLASYTMYKIEVAPITSYGSGKSSEPVFGETCRCKEYVSASLVPSVLDSSGNNSLTKTISDLVKRSCGRCKGNIDGDSTKVISSGSNETTDSLISFPVTMTKPYGDTAYTKFVPIISVPGVVVLRRKGSDSAKLLTKRTADSVFGAWPIFLFTLLTALLAGIIIWFLDSNCNEQHFPRPFLKGAAEGFWWSFISMTTVGYGDRCPQSAPAKIFAMAWFLIGLVIFAVFMGSLTTTLTLTIVRKGSTLNSVTDDGKVAVISSSPEYLLAVNKFRDKITVGSSFPDLSSMLKALQSGNVSSVLLDMYVPVKRKDLLNESLFEVIELLEAQIYHGVLLRGDSVKLASTMKKSITENNVQSNYLKVAEPPETSEDEETSINFFDPSSLYYLLTMTICAGLLLVATLFGLLYQKFFLKRFVDKIKGKEPCSCGETKREIDETVETFHQNISTIYDTLRKRHMEELHSFMIKARKNFKQQR
ncbi:uncharacterized protein [Montipora capricornis]|uniref:uncharacterized protein isoform X1 n=1 Tax=Montipora capricornis TaxID=246305 RepID=UPI0035F1D7BF